MSFEIEITINGLRAAGLSESQILDVLQVAHKNHEEKQALQREQWRIAKRNQRSRPKCPVCPSDKEDMVSPSPPPPSMVSPITPSLTTPSPSPPSISSLRSDGWPSDYREKFWLAYPRKTGKGAAIRKLEAVRKRGEIEFDKLLAAISLIDASEPKFIPHPLTWLNQGRYLDSPTTGPPPTNVVGEEEFARLKAKYDAKIERTA